MKKHYFTFLIAILPLVMSAQTINTVRDTLGVAFYAEYTSSANDTGNTITLSLSATDLGNLSDVTAVEIYRNFELNRIKDRKRIAKDLTGAETGTLVFVDDHETWDDAATPSGSGDFPVGTPASYSVTVITTDGTRYASARTVQAVYIPNLFTPDANVVDEINDDMKIWVRAYSNYPDEESALLVIGLQPSVNYPTDPYKLYQDAIIARSGGALDWSSYPCSTDIYYNNVEGITGRTKAIANITSFAGNPGIMYHKISLADIPDGMIGADGITHISLKYARPNSEQPLNGFTYSSLLSVPVKITATLGIGDNPSAVSTDVSAAGNRIYVSNVKTNTDIKIYSITGALVKSFKTNTDIDFTFKPGLWISLIKTNEGTKSVKLLVK